MVQKNHALISRFQKDVCFIKIVYTYDHVVRELQEGRIGGHFGQDKTIVFKTISLVEDHFFWSRTKKNVWKVK